MRSKKHRPSILLSGAAVLALTSAMPSFAQEAEETEDSARRLNEITVTATRREASIQDVPIAVSAFNPEALEAQGVRDITSLDSLSSSFNLQSSNSESGGTSIRIRGVGTTGNNIGLESSVAVFLDGVFLSRPGVALGDLVDLEQLEVLRGPQGTLFGRNTSAGLLNVTTKAPNLQEVDGFANVSYGNRDFVNVQGGISVPVIEDVLAARVSGSYRMRDGFLTNPTLGIENNDRDRWSLRGQVLFQPTEDISIRLIGDYSETNELCCDAVVLQDVLAPAFAALGPAPSDNGILDPTAGVPISGFDALDDRETNSGQFENPTEQWGISGQLDWDLGFANLTYIGAFRDFQAQSIQDADFSGLDVFSAAGNTAPSATFNGFAGTGFLDTDFFAPGTSAAEIAALPTLTEIETQTHEIRLQGTVFEDRLDWLVGFYYSDEDILNNASLVLGQDFDLLLGASVLATGVNLGPSPIENIFSVPGVMPGLGISPEGTFAFNQFTQAGESFSIFTHNTFAVTGAFNVTVGLRYVDESKDGNFDQLAAQSDACNAVANNVLGGGAVPGAALVLSCFPLGVVANLPASAFIPLLPQTFSDDPNEPGQFVEDFEDDELVYTIKAGYAFSDNVNAYASFTHGFKSGGFNLDASAAAGGADPRFDSEEIDSWEFGLKGSFFDGRVRANAALFHQDITDFQVLEFTGTNFTTFNVGNALSTGVELEIDAQVLNQLTLTSALTYADARFPNDCETDPAALPNATNLCGNRLTNAPEFVGIWGATWEDGLQAFGQDLRYFGNVNVRFETDRRTSTQATLVGTDIPNLFDIQENNTKLNIRLGLGSADGRWKIEGWATNLTDEQNLAITFNLPLRGGPQGRAAFINAPREYGVTLRTRF